MQRVEMDDWPVFMEPSCETLFMCFMTTFKEGIRAGGGISDVLRKPASRLEHIMLFFLPNILFRNSLYFYLLCSYDSRLFSYYCPIILINLLKKNQSMYYYKTNSLELSSEVFF